MPVRIFAGFAAGALGGLLCRAVLGESPALAWIVRYLSDPAGRIFLRLLMMLVIPLVFSALVLGVVSLGDLRRLGRIGAKMLGYTLVVSAIAVAIGIGAVNLVRPGEGLDPALKDRLRASATAVSASSMKLDAGIDLLVRIVPDNPVAAAAGGDMLALMFFALLFGIGLASVLPAEGAPVEADAAARGAIRLREVLEGLYQVTLRLLQLVLAIAPIGIGALLFTMTARFGWDLVLPLGRYVLVVVGALAVHQFGVYALSVRLLGGMSPRRFFTGVREAMLTAFSTSSSSATLPTSLRVAERELGVPKGIAHFVLTIGATANQNGTALFEGVTVLFLAQFYGVALGPGQQLLVVVVCILGGIGTAGVPAGSLPVIALVAQMLGIPAEGVGIILGVDRILDMCRTTVNVTGDLAAAVFIAASERDARTA